jgi:hypothetical protein
MSSRMTMQEKNRVEKPMLKPMLCPLTFCGQAVDDSAVSSW